MLQRLKDRMHHPAHQQQAENQTAEQNADGKLASGFRTPRAAFENVIAQVALRSGRRLQELLDVRKGPLQLTENASGLGLVAAHKSGDRRARFLFESGPKFIANRCRRVGIESLQFAKTALELGRGPVGRGLRLRLPIPVALHDGDIELAAFVAIREHVLLHGLDPLKTTVLLLDRALVGLVAEDQITKQGAGATEHRHQAQTNREQPRAHAQAQIRHADFDRPAPFPTLKGVRHCSGRREPCRPGSEP
ncbi:MAG: hypothetical protein IRZ06_04630 [Nevskia sp.]|nr:hypothetical protein [Nevskia sp.]